MTVIKASEQIFQQANANVNKQVFGNILYNVKAYGATGDGVTDDTSAINKTIADASVKGGTVKFPPGTYNASFTINTDNITLDLDGAAKILGTVSLKGDGFKKSNTVNLTGDWTVFTAGKTSFSGNFAAFSAGDKVIIETTIQDGNYNQIGVDFATVVSASSTQLTIDLATKYTYNNPTISKLTSPSVYVTTTSIAVGDATVTGNYTALFNVGDIVRMDNRTGVSGADGGTSYFELNKVVAIDATKVTFENKFTHGFTNFWMIGLSYIHNISVSGGKINTIYCQYVQHLYITRTQIGLTNDGNSFTISMRYIYNFFVSGIEINASGKPIGLDSVYDYNGTFTNIIATGARGSTDNATVKFMSIINVVIDDITATDSFSTGSQAIQPFMIDYYYTPYKCWNNKLAISSITASGNKNAANLAAPDFWILGLENSSVVNVDCENPIRISNNLNVMYSTLSNNSLLLFDQGCKNVDVVGFRCGSIDISGSNTITVADGVLSSKDASNSRIIWSHGTNANIKLRDIAVNLSTFVTIYLQDTDNVDIDGVIDQASGTFSVQHDVNTTNIRYGVNDFKKATPFGVASIVPTKQYGIPKGVIAPIFILGRNSYSNKGSITGDGTAYNCTYDGDGLNAYNKNNITNQARFTVPPEGAGNYHFSGSIGLQGIAPASHTLAEFYIRKNNTQNYYFDYVPIVTGAAGTLFLKGEAILQLVAGDYIDAYVKISGTSKVVTWAYSELGGQFSARLLFAL